MAMLQKIQNYLTNRNIRNWIKKTNREVSVSNYSLATSIGLVYCIHDTTYQKIIDNYIAFLKTKIGFKHVLMIGYCKEKEIPSFLSDRADITVITKKDIAFNGEPKNESYSSFINSDMDILIDLSSEKVNANQYIISKSKSKFKVGKFETEMKLYDLRIAMNEHQSLQEYIQQINHYLNIISPK